MRGLEILISGDEVLRWGYGRHEIDEWSIMRITQGGIGGMGIDDLHFGLDGFQKARDIHPGSGKRSLEFGAPQNGFQFREGIGAHDGDEAAL